MFYWICKILFSPILWILYPTRFINKRNIPKKGKMILAMNHQSNRDALVLGSHIGRKLHFMAKKELFQKKFSGWVLKKWGAFPVNRTSTDLNAIKTSLKLLKQGKAMAIFPEGTRREGTDMGAVKNGAAMFASKTESPIIPAIFVKKPRPFRFNKVIVGEPFYLHEIFGTTNLTKEQLAEAGKLISEKIMELPQKYEESRKKRKK